MPGPRGSWGDIFGIPKSVGRIIAQYEGHIEQYLGDGIEVIFGWPVAQEDGAERALRAGLQVIQTVTTLPSPRPLAVRIGISTGVVLTGTAASPSSLVGEVLHLAARLQSIARPNSIVISQSTHQLVSARFNCDDLGLQRLKGFPDPIRAFRVRRLREDKSRFQARTSKALTNFVGRAPELGFLNQRWHELIRRRRPGSICLRYSRYREIAHCLRVQQIYCR